MNIFDLRPKFFEIYQLIKCLISTVKKNKTKLQDNVKLITNDLLCDIEYDYNKLLERLDEFLKVNFDTLYLNRKPKGNVLIILPYNEPLIMCIEPVLSAIIAGNTVFVRPSNKNKNIMYIVWNHALKNIPWLSKKLFIIDFDYSETLNFIKKIQAVYFFGSQNVAKKIANKCAEYLVEFWPETESADFAIYDDISIINIKKFADYIFQESFSHSGQICQRIQGLFVHKNYYSQIMIEILNKQKLLSKNKFPTPSAKQIKMRKEYNDLVLKEKNVSYMPGMQENMPSIITDLSVDSPLCKNAFFLPTLWVIPYESNENLIKVVSSRPMQFGCNIWSSDKNFIDKIIFGTKFTRFTVNTSHIRIRNSEGWGGAQPTSFGGYMQWAHKFTNSYTKIL